MKGVVHAGSPRRNALRARRHARPDTRSRAAGHRDPNRASAIGNPTTKHGFVGTPGWRQRQNGAGSLLMRRMITIHMVACLPVLLYGFVPTAWYTWRHVGPTGIRRRAQGQGLLAERSRPPRRGEPAAHRRDRDGRDPHHQIPAADRVDPYLPVIANEVYVFYGERDGESRATIKHLRRAIVDAWQVRQWNPPDGMKPDFALPRRDWPKAHRVIGKYARR